MDDSRYHPDVGKHSNGGVCNFIELLNFRVRSGDVILADHLKNCAENDSIVAVRSYLRK